MNIRKILFCLLYFGSVGHFEKFHLEQISWQSFQRVLLFSAGALNSNNSKIDRIFELDNVNNVVTVEENSIERWPYFTHLDEYKNYVGIAMDLLHFVSSDLNFTFDLFLPPDGKWGGIVNGRWDGMVRELIEDRGDAIFGAFSHTAERQEVIDYSSPFNYVRPSLIFKNHLNDVLKPKSFLFLKPFSSAVWIILAITIVSMGFMLYLNRESNENFLYTTEHLFFFGSIVNQGGSYKLSKSSNYFLVSAWWLFSITVVAIFSGNIIADLATEKLKIPFNSLEELYSSKDYQLIILSGGAYEQVLRNSKNSVYRKLYDSVIEASKNEPDILIPDVNSVIKFVLEGGYAYLTTGAESLKVKYPHLSTIEVGFEVSVNSVGVQKGSYYKEVISTSILKAFESGLIDKWRKKWLKLGTSNLTTSTKLNRNVRMIELRDIADVFYVLFGDYIQNIKAFQQIINIALINTTEYSGYTHCFHNGPYKRHWQKIGVTKDHFLTKHHLFPFSKYGFNGKKMRVGSNYWTSYLDLNPSNGKYSGLIIDLTNYIAGDLNFTYEIVLPKDMSWGTLKNGTWNGLVKQILDKDIDFIIAPLVNSRRLTTALVSFIISIIDVMDKKRFSPSKNILFVFGSVFNQGGCLTSDHRISKRIVISIWWLFAITLVATYCGNIIAYLAINSVKLPFNSAEDLIDNNDYKFLLLPGSSDYDLFRNSTKRPYKPLWTKFQNLISKEPDLLTTDFNYIFNKVLQGGYALITTRLYSLEEKYPHLSRTSSNLELNFYACAAGKESSYTSSLSQSISRTVEFGIIKKWENKWFETQKRQLSSDKSNFHAVVKSILLSDVIGVYIMLAIGLSGAFISLLLEKYIKAMESREKLLMKSK
ncbi:DgyrCDS12875 [Dimorphilus gyrociliatus]|uniref:DgyrCDS12875 n=1 Tax=Dimorphilus gyrociliatus TaxID=2664684 RepID=A0A7I8W906_9ANNE|nr:DgyrCDS12875 [Dimorphilus gyrociliatus]